MVVRVLDIYIISQMDEALHQMNYRIEHVKAVDVGVPCLSAVVTSIYSSNNNFSTARMAIYTIMITFTLRYNCCQGLTTHPAMLISSSRSSCTGRNVVNSKKSLFMVVQEQQLRQSFMQLTQDYGIVELANFSTFNNIAALPSSASPALVDAAASKESHSHQNIIVALNNIVALTSASPSSPSIAFVHAVESHSHQTLLPLSDTTTDAGSDVKSYATSSSKLHKKYLGKHIISNLLNEDIDGEEDNEDDASKPALGNIHMSESAKLFVSQAVKAALTTPNESTSSNNNRSSNNVMDANSNIYNKQQLKATTTTTRVRASVKETGNDALSSYLKNIANHDLLQHEDEVVLGRQIQTLVKYEQQRLLLETTLLRKPTYAEWAQAVGEITVSSLKKQIRRSQRAKAAMVEANLRNVVSIARQTFRQQRKKSESSSSSFQDLCQQGIIGLAKACERFDPDKGVRFYTYANWYIKQEVTISANEQARIIRLPPNAISRINTIRVAEVQLTATNRRKPTDEDVAKHLNMPVQKVQFYKRSANDVVVASLNKVLTSGGNNKGSSAGSGSSSSGDTTLEHIIKDPGETPADVAAKQMLREDVRRLIGTLSPREQAVIRLRFGLDDGQPRTLEYIGNKFAVSKEKIRKIETSALLKLRQPYRHESVKVYVSDL